MTASFPARTTIRDGLAAIVGEAAVADWAPDAGRGGVGPRPWLTVRPTSSDQVRDIVRLANETRTPLIPLSSSGPHRHGASTPEVDGAVEVDLRGMNRILRVDRRNRMALIEPGVTYEQLVPALAEHGLRFNLPLLPRPGKSVIASLLEREARLVPRWQWSPMEPLRTLEVIWGNGERLFTGTGHLRGERDEDWAEGKIPVMAGGPAQLDFFRLISGAQGAMGIATWASVKCEPIADARALVVIPATRLEDLIPLAYEVVRIRFGDETFLANAAALAMATGLGAAALPAWSLVLGIGGGPILGAEKVAAREADIREIAARHGLAVDAGVGGLAGLPGDDLLGRLQGVAPTPYWKDNEATGSEELLFLSTLDRMPALLEAAGAAAGNAGLATGSLGVYLQPIHQGAGLHVELLFGFDRARPSSVEAARLARAEAASVLFGEGAWFSRPYGEAARWVFEADPPTAGLTRTIKDIFDPHNVMNPGKLCFPRDVH